MNEKMMFILNGGRSRSSKMLVDGWMNIKAVVRIAYCNPKTTY
jgi:hypothetical protein